jgi:hypothetical protein
MVDEHLRHLKSVLEREGRRFIEEVAGVGYRFEPGPPATGIRYPRQDKSDEEGI